MGLAAEFPRGETGTPSVYFCLVFAFPAGIKAFKVQDCAAIAAAGGSCLHCLFQHLRLPRAGQVFPALEEKALQGGRCSGASSVLPVGGGGYIWSWDPGQ